MLPLQEDKILILDGASGTLLENQNVKLHPTLWSAIALIEDQQAVEDMHLAYYDAGANIASTATYQASFPGFKDHLSSGETHKIMAGAVQLARNAASRSSGTQPKYVAASLGPYGAYLCQGQEYTGDYGSVSDQELYDFHKPRLDAVIDGKPDVVLFETIPTLQEVKVIRRLTEESRFPTWVAFSVKSEGTVTLADGSSLEEALAECEIFPVVGANCFPIKDTNNVLEQFNAKTKKPLVIYPNSGEIYDAKAKVWHEPSPKHNAGWDIDQWYSRGARVIGGCCRSEPAHINGLAQRSTLINYK